MSVSERVPTGVPGLDEILCGGFLRDRIYLVQGDPGTGKTTLALQYLLECNRRGETGLLITLAENRIDLGTVADAHGWTLDGLNICDLTSSEDSLRADAQYTVFHPSEVELGETTKAILAEVERLKPLHVAFDGLSEVRLLARDPLRYRRQMLALKQYFSDKSITVLLMDDRSTPLGDIQPESVVTGVICIEQNMPVYGGSRRRLRVSKVRGSTFVSGYHDYDITPAGLVVHPRLVAATYHTPFDPFSVPSGIAQLDSMVGGGLEAGTTTVIMGPAGVGKSTVTMHYLSCALERGIKAAAYTFDEVLHTLMRRASVMAPSIQEHMSRGSLHIAQVDPAALSPGAFAAEVRRAVEQMGARMIVIDSLNGYVSSMPEERFLATHLHELFAYLNQRGVVTILVVAQHGLLGTDEGFAITYLADMVLLMRYFESHGELRQAISVFKKRTGPHERALRELKITSGGLVVGEPLRQFQGIMTGVPQYGTPGQEAGG